MFGNSDFKRALKKAFADAYLDAIQDHSALTRFLSANTTLQFNNTTCTNNSSVSIKQSANRWICTDFGNPQLSGLVSGKAYDLKGMFYVLYPNDSDKQIAELSLLGYGGYFANLPAKSSTNTPAKQAPNPKPNLPATPTVQKNVKKRVGTYSQKAQTTVWNSPEGYELFAYFAGKIGVWDFNDHTIWLEKQGITPLSCVTHKDFNNPQNPCGNFHAFTVGKLQKLKGIPTNPTAKKAYTYQGFGVTSEFYFGLDSLPTNPKSTDKLIFVEGEPDVLCGDLHLNQHGIYFITVGSANGYLSDSVQKDLKNRFGSNIFVLWDNDAKGTLSKDFAAQNGFYWINPKTFYPKNIKDVCEFYAQNRYELETFVSHFLEKFAPKPRPFAIPAIVGDRFSIGVERAISYEFNQYLGEKTSLKTVLDTILRTPRLALQAPAGAGKTTLLLELAKRVGKPTLIFAPVRGIVEQNAHAFKAQIKAQNLDLELLFINKHTHPNDTETHINAYGNNTIIIGTYDCLTPNRFPTELLQKCCLVFDEFHQFANDFNYRRTAMGRVEDVLKNPNQPALLLSATPNYFFNSGLIDMLNFNLFVGIPHVQNTIRLQPILYDKNKRFAIETLYDRITAHKIERGTNGVILVKFDSVDTLEVWERFLLKKGAKVSVFASKGKEIYQKNPNLDRILGESVDAELDELEDDPFNFDQPIEKHSEFVSGELAEHVDFILTTTKSEAGISFNFAVDLVISVDTLAASRLIQFANRPRYNVSTGVNKVVDFWVLLPEKIETKKDQQTCKQTATQIFKEHLHTAQIAAQQFNDMLAKATNRTETVKSLLSGKDVISSQRNKYVRYSLRSETFEVSTFSILYDIHQKETNGSNLNDILTRIQHTDKRIKILPTQPLSIEKTSELEEYFEEIKEAKEAKETAFLELCKKDFYTVAKVLAKDAKKGTKVILEEFLLTQPAYFDPNFADQHKQAFEFADKTTYALRIIKEFEKAGYPAKRPRNKTIEGFINAVFERSESETRTLATRTARTNLWRLYAKGEVSPTDRRELEKEIHPAIQILKKRLKNIKLGKYKKTSQGFEPAEFYATLYNQHITQNVKFSAITAIELVKVDFELEEKRDRKDDKDRTLYALKDRVKKTPK
jgi:DEAD/DEAH box helicase